VYCIKDTNDGFTGKKSNHLIGRLEGACGLLQATGVFMVAVIILF
jgi:hypothetical protein